MQKPLLIVAALAVVAAGGYAFVAARPAAEQPGASLIMPSGAAQAQTEVAVDTSNVFEVSIGNPDAPVTIIEYSSFTCPHCANFNRGVYRQLVENYVDTGIVRFVKREVYFDAYGLWAGLVARCGGEERYLGIVEMLYENQRDWAGQQDGTAAADQLRRIGRRAGMNDAQLDACLTDRDMATAMMEVYRTNAARDEIRSTPSFMINGRLFSNMSFAEFETAITNAQN
jgi:protein-disulfide isomerase